jgi:hypothetical protein
LLLLQAADATAAALNGGINRCQVEIHLPEFWGEEQQLVLWQADYLRYGLNMHLLALAS